MVQFLWLFSELALYQIRELSSRSVDLGRNPRPEMGSVAVQFNSQQPIIESARIQNNSNKRNKHKKKQTSNEKKYRLSII
jgi:hypothetical protein